MKFTPEIRRQAIEMAKTVNFKTTIAKRLRMHSNTLESWLTRGMTDAEGNPLDDHPDVMEYVQFRLEFEAARATLESEIADEARGKNPAFVLERAYRHWNAKSVLTGMEAGEALGPDAKAAAINELRGMSGDLLAVIETAWCDGELGNAPAGVKQLFDAMGKRWGWTVPQAGR